MANFLNCLLVMLILLFGCSCGDRKTKISVTGNSIPVFTLSGSGLITDFAIYGPRQRAGDQQAAFAVWQLVPVSDIDSLDDVSSISSIKYGIIPKGYKQVYPEGGTSPTPLPEGVKYLLQITTVNAPWGQLAFEIRAGRAVEIPIK